MTEKQRECFLNELASVIMNRVKKGQSLPELLGLIEMAKIMTIRMYYNEPIEMKEPPDGS